MLQLRNISKEYGTGEKGVSALRDVSVQFRDSEFVSILGPSGCGKTTLLNIIGGLDACTEGELWIDGRSTASFHQKDWDAYRNHRVGFVFQSYHLIPHLSILQNVELALTLSGVSRKERKSRARDALSRVGLAEQLHKKPMELSGGQMQRVAIARALVNDPEILLADEPTGALDSQTSLQVMKLLQEIAGERLVIMVTHNPELATHYSTRILHMVDGQIIKDSDPVEGPALERMDCTLHTEHLPGMSAGTAIGLSLRNLFTKKSRVALTAFAGSIGIIGIALVFAISQGTSDYIQKIQEDTLTAYPLTLEASAINLGDMVNSLMATNPQQKPASDPDAVTARPVLQHLVQAMQNLQGTENDLHGFYLALQEKVREDPTLQQALSAVACTYSLDLPVYRIAEDGQVQVYDPKTFMQQLVSSQISGQSGVGLPLASGALPLSGMGQMIAGEAINLWSPMLRGMNGELISPLLKNQYELLSGSWPERYDQVVVVVDENNTLDDMTLYALGLKSKEEIEQLLAKEGQEVSAENTQTWHYGQIINAEIRVVPNYLCYVPNTDTNRYTDLRETETGLQALYQQGIPLRVSGILRPKKSEDRMLLRGTIGYTQELVEYLAEQGSRSAAITEQLRNPRIDMQNGLPFHGAGKELSQEEKAVLFRQIVEKMEPEEQSRVYEKIQSLSEQTQPTRRQMEASLRAVLAQQMQLQQAESYVAVLSDAELMRLYQTLQTQQTPGEENARQKLLQALPEYTQDQCSRFFDEVLTFSDSTLDANLQKFGYVDPRKPEAIHLYAASFEQKAVIVQALESYNGSVEEEKQIYYTDYVGLIMSSVSSMLRAVTWVLVGFVGISLVVSSIMIGVITLISVQERTKEIGILRAIGASRGDVSGVFLAETGLIGLASGILGVSLSLALIALINSVLGSISDISGLQVHLSWQTGLMLIAVSVGFTLFAGILPSRRAAGKDPVVALRTE